MNETVFCRCSTCGYEWKRGQHGGHDCAQTLDAHYEAVSAKSAARIAELEEELETIKNYESPVKSYKIVAWQRDYARKQLASAQAGNVRLRKSLTDILNEPQESFSNAKAVEYIVKLAKHALAQPLDTSALDAYVHKEMEAFHQWASKEVEQLRAKLEALTPLMVKTMDQIDADTEAHKFRSSRRERRKGRRVPL